MDNHLNETIIEKVVIKKAAIYKAIAMLPPPPFEDKFAKETLCQQNENIQKLNSEKCLNEIEPNNEKKVNDTMNETKTVNELENWRTITDPKLRKKMRRKAWEKANKDRIKEQGKTYYEVNKDKIKIQEKLYRLKNKIKIKERKKNYYQDNKETINLRTKEYKKHRCKNDIQYRLACRLRNRLCDVFRGKYKSGSAVKDLGCTVNELKVYLESKFQTGMSWDNYGYYGWHIDHIKPLASFDLSDRKQLLEACHYTNLQPLWAKDNISKGNKLEDQFASSLLLNGATR